jgi:hypothetical protein
MMDFQYKNVNTANLDADLLALFITHIFKNWATFLNLTFCYFIW